MPALTKTTNCKDYKTSRTTTKFVRCIETVNETVAAISLKDAMTGRLAPKMPTAIIHHTFNQHVNFCSSVCKIVYRDLTIPSYTV